MHPKDVLNGTITQDFHHVALFLVTASKFCKLQHFLTVLKPAVLNMSLFMDQASCTYFIFCRELLLSIILFLHRFHFYKAQRVANTDHEN